MNKYILLAVLVFIILGMTFMANAATNLDPSYSPNPGSIEEDIPQEFDISIGTIKSVVNTWVKLATFNMEGFPGWVSVLIFLPLNFIVIYMIIDILKDAIPF